MNLLSQTAVKSSSWPVAPVDDIPILFEDEEEEMGEANTHALGALVLFGCLPSLLRIRQPLYQVFDNLNCYYEAMGRRSSKTGNKANFASDIMIVKPYVKLAVETSSYTIGKDGPEPTTVFEVLSKETAFQRDLKEKLELYRQLKIQEYILVDLTGVFLPQKIQFRSLQANGEWQIQVDSDGGVTSQLGFRLLIDETDPVGLFVVDALTGKRCVRPFEAENRVAEETEARILAEEQAKSEADARRLAEQQAKSEADARRLAEQQAKSEADARRLAEQQVKSEAERANLEAEARRLAEEQLRALQSEIERLRNPKQQ